MIATLEKMLQEQWPDFTLNVDIDKRNIVTVTGEVKDWNTVVQVGHAIAKVEGVKNVVNEMTVGGLTIPKKDYTPYIMAGKEKGIVEETDVIIIGAGVSGCGVARTLAKYDVKITVVEMGEDVATAASKANNGNIHAGHAVQIGTLKAKLNIEGNRMYTQWAQELGFEFQRCGALGVIPSEEDMPALDIAYKVAKTNGIDVVEKVDAKRALELEPKLKRTGIDIKAGIWLPSMGVVEPYEVVVALAENAAENGVKFRFNCTVGEILAENGKVTGVVTNQGIIKAKYIINCAGVYSDEISAMAGDKSYTIHPRKGTIAILDKNAEPEFDCLCEIVSMKALMALKKNKESKGGGMSRTPEWNILLGPSAEEVPDKEDNSTSPDTLAYSIGRNQNENVSYGNVIRYFAGVRAADYKEDFVIEMSPVTHGFINCGAIQSPGLASAPAISKMVSEILIQDWVCVGYPLEEKKNYNPIRKPKKKFRHLSHEEQDQLIRENPAYGHVICRCETITEGEIIDAMHSPIVPTSIDAIKRRTRAGMGRCQGGFCQPRVLEILARELGKEWVDINLSGANTNILLKPTRSEA
ncbi:FAD-dependent oxidoreductase [Clostridium sp. CS001]|uniref:FAD-dependent oxidoreductase n=1 Tax=Clostridium sp. CS001 TaxID=2880648 RepID=UPI001CF2B1D3|nr:FAD-dependent oxidoreductase [Clostridium sp. CS001]MCB2289846.1 FAD-dependent oxidoreductase [Clostridium sp. CS001]